MESGNVSDIWVKPTLGMMLTSQKCLQILKNKNIAKYFDLSFKSDSGNRDKFFIKLVKYWGIQNVLILIL